MSYLRHGQDGQYVDIPNGSNYYLYDNGREIQGWSYGEWAALIGTVVREVDYEPSQNIEDAFIEHFDGWDEDYLSIITPPERAEIFCQCVDSRIDSLELKDELHEAVQEWADEFDALRECEYCDNELRPTLYYDDTRYVCSRDECEMKSEAETYGLTVKQLKEARTFDDFDDEWDYIVEHSDKEL